MTPELCGGIVHPSSRELLIWSKRAVAGNIFEVKYANQADAKIYFVTYANQADVKVYLVKYQNQAKWKKSSRFRGSFK